MDPGLQVRSRKEFISPIRRILSFAGSILENDFQPALPGLAPLVPGKFRRNLKTGTAPSGFSFRRLPVKRPSPSERFLQPKAKKAKREVRLSSSYVWASTKRIMEVESMVSNITAENRLLRSQISKMILLICLGVIRLFLLLRTRTFRI